MKITDAIFNADTKEEVFSLLTYYLDALRFGDNTNKLPEALTELPLAGADDVRRRIRKLITELDAASKRLDDRACLVIKEALAIFLAAIHRFDSPGAGRQPAITAREKVPV